MSVGKHEREFVQQVQTLLKDIAANSDLCALSQDEAAKGCQSENIVDAVHYAGKVMLALTAERDAAKVLEERLRAVITHIMSETGLTQVALPYHEMELVEGGASFIVTDISKVPEHLKVTSPPKVDRALANKALKVGKVDGLELTNGEPHVRIRSSVTRYKSKEQKQK